MLAISYVKFDTTTVFSDWSRSKPTLSYVHDETISLSNYWSIYWSACPSCHLWRFCR